MNGYVLKLGEDSYYNVGGTVVRPEDAMQFPTEQMARDFWMDRVKVELAQPTAAPFVATAYDPFGLNRRG